MGERALTAGEITLAQRIYKTAIDYTRVKVYNRKYILIQPGNSGMTPNGNIYASGDVYDSDYSTKEPALRAFFIHEMAHVWQYQLNILSPTLSAISERFRSPFNYSRAYEYELVAGKDLLDYRIEQQAQIIEDYYLYFIEAIQPSPKRILNTGASSTYIQLYNQVLSRFLANPGYAKHVWVCKKDNFGPPGSRSTTCRRELAP